jgi:hypothetical protein
MTIGCLRSRSVIAVVFLAVLPLLLTITSCSNNESKAKKLIEEYYAPYGVKDVTVDFFYTDSKYPDKAYTSATVTHSFASSRGTEQREFVGFILAREAKGWRIESNSSYTKESQKAVVYLGGGK